MLSIKERQTYLKKLGYYTGTVDGIEGAKTKAAYKAFQKAYGLVVDGIYGAKTNAKLKEVYMLIGGIKMLTIKERQTYLKKYGFYTGKIDGIVGPLTKKAYLALQKKYFVRKMDIDGIYGPNTDILLVNLHRVKTYTKNFELKEFRCGCKGKHCTGYPEYLSIQMLKNLQATRNWLKRPVSVRSGLRCIRYNATLKGSSPKSGHLKGKAVDMYSYPKSLTAKGRKQIIAYFKKLPGYYYAYQGTSNMGFSTHLEVKE